jgi:hypothetical protein
LQDLGFDGLPKVTTDTMPSRGRHQSSSKECHRMMRRIEAMNGVVAVIIGRSYGGKSLGQGIPTGSLKVQRKISGGLKAVTQSGKGLQEIFIRTDAGMEDSIAEAILKM